MRALDWQSGTPIAGVAIYVISPSQSESSVATTGSDGAATFAIASTGNYRLVARLRGYQDLSTDVNVRSDAETTTVIRMVSSLQQIGHVSSKSHSNASTTYQSLNRDSAEVRLSKSLIDALGSLGGVEVVRGAGGDAGISLRGKDQSLTNYSFDGQQIANPLADRSFDPDLIQSAQVDQSNDSVNFTLLHPTSDPTYGDTTTIGGFGLRKTDFTAQGKTGSIGYAFEHIDRNLLSELDHSTFLDTSGLDYSHEGWYHNVSDLLTLTAPLSSTWDASLTLTRADHHDQVVPAYFSGTLPFGYGPGNSTFGRSSNASAVITGALPRMLVSIAVSGGSAFSEQDEQSRLVDGTAVPSVGSDTFSASTVSVSATFLDSHATMVNFVSTVGNSRSNVSDAALDAATLVPLNVSGTSSLQTLRISQTQKISKKVTLMPSLTAERGNGQGVLASDRLGWNIAASKRDTIVGMVSVEAHAPSPFFSSGVPPDPNTATYDCSSGSASLYGSNDKPDATHAARLQSEWSHSSSSGGFSVGAYGERYTGVTLSDAFASGLGQLSPTGIAQVVSGFGQSGGCSGALDPQRIYVIRNVAGASAFYRGVNATVNRRIGPRTQVQLRYDLQYSSLLKVPSSLVSASSPYVLGGQLPGQPVQRIGLTVGYDLPFRNIQLIVGAQHVAVNNPNRLPPYTLVSFGLEKTLSSAVTFDIVASNVTHQYVSLFSSPQFSVPVSTNSAAPLLLNAAPLPQPEIFIRLNVKMSHSNL